MSLQSKSLRGIIVLAALLALVIVGNSLRETENTPENLDTPPLPEGAIPIYQDDVLVGAIDVNLLEALPETSFVDDEEGQTQHGWLLDDILPSILDTNDFTPETTFLISSSTRDKSAEVTWAQINETENFVMFDLSGRGTLKLVSKSIDDLDERDEWVQDVDRINIVRAAE